MCTCVCASVCLGGWGAEEENPERVTVGSGKQSSVSTIHKERQREKENNVKGARSDQKDGGQPEEAEERGQVPILGLARKSPRVQKQQELDRAEIMGTLQEQMSLGTKDELYEDAAQIRDAAAITEQKNLQDPLTLARKSSALRKQHSFGNLPQWQGGRSLCCCGKWEI
jgi:hypothetical protein